MYERYYRDKASEHAQMLHDMGGMHNVNMVFESELGVSGTALEFLAIEDWSPTMPNMLELLMEEGANPEVYRIRGKTPLMNFISPISDFEMEHKFPIVQQLLDFGVDVDASTTTGWCALHSACRRGWTKVVELLIDRGANVNSLTDGLRTPLHVAVTYGNEHTARFLIKHGADLRAKDMDGETAIECAKDVGTCAYCSIAEFAEEFESMMKGHRLDALAIGYHHSHIKNELQGTGPNIWDIGPDPLKMIMKHVHRDHENW
jgi:hypothetical protein